MSSPTGKRPDVRQLLLARIAARNLKAVLVHVNLISATKNVRQPVQAARAAADFAEISLTAALRAAHETGAYSKGSALDDLDAWLANELAKAPEVSGEKLDWVWDMLKVVAERGPVFEG